jgi:intracellular sulfur oxidation DsrE/DsrF family protein
MASRKIVVIGSRTLGRGDDHIGTVIMTNFLNFLAEQEAKPKAIILWNTGVRIAAEDGEQTLEKVQAQEHLRRLEEQGVEVLVCRTCLEHFKLLDRIRVGKVSSMKHFASLLMNPDFEVVCA